MLLSGSTIGGTLNPDGTRRIQECGVFDLACKTGRLIDFFKGTPPPPGTEFQSGTLGSGSEPHVTAVIETVKSVTGWVKPVLIGGAVLLAAWLALRAYEAYKR